MIRVQTEPFDLGEESNRFLAEVAGIDRDCLSGGAADGSPASGADAPKPKARATPASAEPAGAVVTFTGVVRDRPGGGLLAMEIEHYPGMTERAIGAIVDQARGRWNLSGVHVIHRTGRLVAGEVIMMVATASPHRAEAFAAAEYLMDYLKSRAPFWKREITSDGAEWVAAKDGDEDALKRW